MLGIIKNQVMSLYKFIMKPHLEYLWDCITSCPGLHVTMVHGLDKPDIDIHSLMVIEGNDLVLYPKYNIYIYKILSFSYLKTTGIMKK